MVSYAESSHAVAHSLQNDNTNNSRRGREGLTWRV
jgi:hypothetical protein